MYWKSTKLTMEQPAADTTVRGPGSASIIPEALVAAKYLTMHASADLDLI